MEAFLEFVGRGLLATPFLVSAVAKSLKPSAARTEIAELIAPIGLRVAPAHILPLVLAVQFAGGGLLLVRSTSALGAALLLAFLVPVTLIAHAFWSAPPANQTAKKDHFLANAAIAGGLLLVLKGVGP